MDVRRKITRSVRSTHRPLSQHRSQNLTAQQNINPLQNKNQQVDRKNQNLQSRRVSQDAGGRKDTQNRTRYRKSNNQLHFQHPQQQESVCRKSQTSPKQPISPYSHQRIWNYREEKESLNHAQHTFQVYKPESDRGLLESGHFGTRTAKKAEDPWEEKTALKYFDIKAASLLKP